MQGHHDREIQQAIITELAVAAHSDAEEDLRRRIEFLADYLISSGLTTLILGISGGIDSTTTGRMAQLAVERVRAQGNDAEFLAMRLPYGVQRDEADAQTALQFIRPDRTITIDIKPATDAMLAALVMGELTFLHAAHQDFVVGNIKARQRMIAHYGVANVHAGLVLGTDHAAEAVMGFFTKFGDGACDLAPLSGLTKRRVRAIATVLGVPISLIHKVPTADLESLSPQRPDEDAYGISYDEIDDFLEGKVVSAPVYDTILKFYNGSKHKRALPLRPHSAGQTAQKDLVDKT